MGASPRRGEPSATSLGVSQRQTPTTKERTREQRSVCIDFHRRRSVIVHKDSAGTNLETVQLDDDH
jgi:hypothetical protein